MGNAGTIVPSRGYLAGLRRITERAGALLILDEVMTGFRLALGGAQQLYEVQRRTCTTLGKILGGGLPCGAFGGRAEVMECLAPLGPVYQAGTLSGNPLAMAAGIATLGHLLEHERADLSAAGAGRRAAMAEGVAGLAREAGHPGDDEPGGIDVDVVLYGRAGWNFADCRDERHGGVWAVSSRDDGGGGVAAAEPVRGGVCVRRRMGRRRWCCCWRRRGGAAGVARLYHGDRHLSAGCRSGAANESRRVGYARVE